MAKMFHCSESILVDASPPYKPDTKYAICLGKEYIKNGNSEKDDDIVEAEVIKVVMVLNGEMVANKAPAIIANSYDYHCVTMAMNKLLSKLKIDEITPVSLLIQRNNKGNVSLEEVRFYGTAIYNRSFNIEHEHDAEGNFIRYTNHHPFLEKLIQSPTVTDNIYYIYRIYRTKTNKLLVYSEYVHSNNIGEYLYIDSDYHICDDIAEVNGYCHGLSQNDIIYLFYMRGNVKITERYDI